MTERMKNIIPVLRYSILTIKHKYFVLVAGLRLGGTPGQLLFHDMSKFFPSEISHYGKQFFGTKNDPKGFIRCWIHHQNKNPHHWEYWIPRTGYNRCEPPYPDNIPIEMPEKYIIEMVADWLGASRAYEGKWPQSTKEWTWLNKNFERINLHTNTRIKVKILLGVYFML